MDVKKIPELKKSSQSPALEIGGAMVLNDIMELLKTMAQNNQAYKYGQAIVDHIQVVSRYLFDCYGSGTRNVL